MRATAEYLDLARGWAGHADRVALDDGYQQVRYAELDARVDAVARGLADLGARRVGLLADNGVDAALAVVAALRAGLPLVVLPTFFSATQLAGALDDAALDTVLVGPGAPAGELAGMRRPAPGTRGLAALRRPAAGAGEPFERVTFTSGSSGSPKGVVLARSALVDVACSLCDATEMTAADRHLCALPLAVLLEEVGGLLRGLAAGACVLLPSARERGLDGSTGFDPERFGAALCERRATSTILVPQMLAAWLDAIEAGRVPAPRALSFVGVGGASVPPALLARAAALGLPVFEGYGMSEATSVVTLNTRAASRSGTSGRPLPHARVRVAPDGELLVAGALATGMLGGGALPLDADGFLATGDVGRVDDDGFVTVLGRKDERIVTAFGRNVSPEWVERELECEPEVARAAVVAAGAWPCAVIVARHGVDEAALAAAVERVNARLPDYARVLGPVAARATFSPRDGTATTKGAPRRAALAELYHAEIDRSIGGRRGALAPRRGA